MLSENERSAIRELGKVLISNEYSSYLSLALGEGVYYKNPLPEYNTVFTAIKKLPHRIQEFAKFLSLGLPIKISEIEKYISMQTINVLKELEVLNFDEEEVWLNNYLLISYSNCYVFVGNVYYYPTCQSKEQIPYIGLDSYWLSRMINCRVSGNVLDLCSGSGIQAIIASKTAEKVVAVDIDPQAVRMIEINACLNFADSKLSVRLGNLFDVVDDEKFDYIICNPPFIPIPEEVPFPISGDGGELGDKIIKTIFQNAKDYLKPYGNLLMIGQTIGSKDKVHLSELIEKYLSGFSINATYYSRTPIENQAVEFAKLATMVNNQTVSGEKWLVNYERVKAVYFYSFLLRCEKDTSGVLEENLFDDSWQDTDIPVLKAVCQNAPPNYILSVNGKVSITVDEEVLEFVKRIDGKSTLYELLESMPLKYRLKYGKNSNVKMLAKYFVLCSQLEHFSVLERR